MTILKSVIALALATSVSGAAWAAGSGGHDHDHSSGHQMQVDRTVEVTANDIEFDMSEIDVMPGETIRFLIHNQGEMDHDFTIGDHATQMAHRQEMMEMMHGGHDMMGHMHGAQNAVMIPPGETRELIWTFAETEGLEFGCNVPGHYEAGMHGQFMTQD